MDLESPRSPTTVAGPVPAEYTRSGTPAMTYGFLALCASPRGGAHRTGGTVSTLVIRKVVSQVEETRSVAGRNDDGGPLRKVAVCAIVSNPYAGQGYVDDLTSVVEASAEIGTFLGEEAIRLLGTEPAS